MPKFPVLRSEIKSKKIFDSADYFMERERDKPEIIKIDKQQTTQTVPNVSQHKRPLLNNGRVTKKVFDSADYFMEQQKPKQVI